MNNALLQDFTNQIRAALRGEGGADVSVRPDRKIRRLALIAIVSLMTYGAAMGSYGLLNGDSGLQILFSAIKTPMLIVVTFLLTFPSFWVINTMLGLRADMRPVIEALLSTQVAMAIALVSLCPLTLFWYLSVRDYQVAILFNGFIFALASLGAQRPLRQRYAPLIKKNRLHKWMLWIWMVVYMFVAIQMGYVLRPFIGRPELDPQFFRSQKWDNAYVIITKMVWNNFKMMGK